MAHGNFSYQNFGSAGDGDLHPGPCDPESVPKPTEIVCIETVKVYDFCFQQEVREPTALLTFEGVVLDEPFDIFCEVIDFRCEEVEREPLNADGLQEVTLEIHYEVEVTIVQNEIEASDIISDTFRKTIILCAPEGTEIDCHTHTDIQCEDVFIVRVIEEGELYPPVPAEAEVTATVIVCLVVQSRALVKLLVPSFGFCFPAPCVEAPFVKPCPPEPLFPPQC